MKRETDNQSYVDGIRVPVHLDPNRRTFSFGSRFEKKKRQVKSSVQAPSVVFIRSASVVVEGERMGSVVAQIPTSFGHELRACLRCRLVKTYDQVLSFAFIVYSLTLFFFNLGFVL